MILKIFLIFCKPEIDRNNVVQLGPVKFYWENESNASFVLCRFSGMFKFMESKILFLIQFKSFIFIKCRTLRFGLLRHRWYFYAWFLFFLFCTFPVRTETFFHEKSIVNYNFIFYWNITDLPTVYLFWHLKSLTPKLSEDSWVPFSLRNFLKSIQSL